MKIKSVLIAISMSALLLVGCSRNIPTGDTSMTSLDWAGTYAGVLPCADCQGTDTQIVLNQDLTYVYTATFLGKTAVPVAAEGQFEWNQDQTTVTFLDNPEPNQYFVAENKLIPLDSNQEQLSEEYHLFKEILLDLDAPSGQDTDETAATDTDNSRTELSALTATKWNLIELNGQEVSETNAYIQFSTDMQVSGSGGCNNFSGQFTSANDTELSFSPLAATLMFCIEAADNETEFFQALEQVDNYTVSADNQTLSLNKGRTAPLARFSSEQTTQVSDQKAKTE